jgi:hypothetical protein
MGGNRTPGSEGTRPQLSGQQEGLPTRAGAGFGPATGVESPVPLQVRRIIARVDKDWVPPNPRTTPEIEVTGQTLQQVADQLSGLTEWGQAGGSIRSDRIGAGTSTNLTVSLHANLVFRLPTWTRYNQASAAAKAEWNRMMGRLRAHEQRHLDIAIEEADSLAQDLVGREISEIAGLVTAANNTMRQRQEQLDDDTDHGARGGVSYGDVYLDTSIP